VDASSKPSQPVLTLYEASHESPRASRRQSVNTNAGLPQSFAALRPASLPVPSNVRPPPRSDFSISATLREPASGSRRPTKSKTSRRIEADPSSVERPLSPQEAELLRLVAADMPSHRGLWTRDSDAWRIFERKGKGRRSPSLDEEDEDNAAEDEGNRNAAGEGFGEHLDQNEPEWTKYRPSQVAASLPVPMAPISQMHANGKPASLQPKTSLADRPGILVPPLPSLAEEGEESKKPAATVRKEAYAERDRKRSMDPGVLDFATDEADDEDANSSPETPDDDVEQISTSRGRQHALKILKARSEVPAEGLWRSLAT